MAAIIAGAVVWFLCYQALGTVGIFFGWIPALVAASIVAMIWPFGWAPLLVIGLFAMATYIDATVPRPESPAANIASQ